MIRLRLYEVEKPLLKGCYHSGYYPGTVKEGVKPMYLLTPIKRRRFFMSFSKVIFLMIAVLWISPEFVFSQNQAKGVVTGQVVDRETGDPLIGVNVLLKETVLGTATDLEGNYRINRVPPGQYILRISYMGYETREITDVQVKAGEVVRFDVAMSKEVIQGEVVTVTAKAVQNTEAVLLKNRQKASAVSDAISAEAIAKVGSGNAADAMKQVTGASVVDGKYVFVRGLGDRYTSTQLNGVEIPSTDPYKRAGSIDMIPSNLVDNIVTLKSFTPDKPGNFSGGTVDIKTRDFPDAFTFNLSLSSSYNSSVNLKDGLYTYSGGNTDWLGLDDGTRDIPEVLQNQRFESTYAGITKLDYMSTFNQYVDAFSSNMVPNKGKLPLNQSYSMSIGNQIELLNRPFGFMASLSYNRSYSGYTSGNYTVWEVGTINQPEMTHTINYSDSRSTDNVLWGGLLKTSYKLTPFHIISFNAIYNRNAEDQVRFLEGKNSYNSDIEVYDMLTSVIHYNEREMRSFQFEGDHHFAGLLGMKLNWKASLNKTIQDEPDLRTFTVKKVVDEEQKSYKYRLPNIILPERYFRNMEEDKNELQLDMLFPFEQWSGQLSQFKIGGLLSAKDRFFEERKFGYKDPSAITWDSDDFNETLFSQENAGMVYDSTTQRYSMNLYINDTATNFPVYSGTEDIGAVYAMLDMPIFSRLRFVGGLRYEETHMYVVDKDTLSQQNINANGIYEEKRVGEIDTEDILPSINFIYAVKENMNLRLALTKTLARPNIREIAPSWSEEFKGGYIYIGSDNLNRTLITNYDLRWEWFSRPGEILAVSAFYKQLEDPIEEVIVNQNRHVKWKNVDEAIVAGLEFEFRKGLDILSDHLRHFTLGSNFSYVHSQVDIDSVELGFKEDIYENPETTRAMAGQSPYILNVNLSYDNSNAGIHSTLYYNVFGKRLSRVNYGGSPDIYEESAPLLNWSLGWNIIDHVSLKVGVKNILDAEMKKTQEFKGEEYIHNVYRRGRAFSMGLKFSL